jgi:hypothetical protein
MAAVLAIRSPPATVFVAKYTCENPRGTALAQWIFRFALRESHGSLSAIPKGGRMSASSSFAQFWPEYVRAHSEASTRFMHCAGTLCGWAILVAAIVKREWWWIPLALVIPYALAWISHFFIEHNKPATFEHPLWSWWADQKMVAMMLTGKMSREVARLREVSS